MVPLCIYHAGCDDGFASAWIVRKALNGAVEFHEGRYGDPLPDVDDRDVLIVDFSYKAPELQECARRARTVLLIDHHKTAVEELAKLEGLAGYWPDVNFPMSGYDPNDIYTVAVTNNIGAAARYIDMKRSGAGLTWDRLFPQTPRPRFIDHIEDRDLWRFALPDTKDFSTALRSYPQDFAVWDSLVDRVDELISDGRIINRYYDQKVTEFAATAVLRTLDGHSVKVANVPYAFASDVANELAKDAPFGATYYDMGDTRGWSLRSAQDGLDVSEVAKRYGGGGHKHAAGFKTDADFTAPLSLAAIAEVRSQ